STSGFTPCARASSASSPISRSSVASPPATRRLWPVFSASRCSEPFVDGSGLSTGAQQLQKSLITFQLMYKMLHPRIRSGAMAEGVVLTEAESSRISWAANFLGVERDEVLRVVCRIKSYLSSKPALV